MALIAYASSNLVEALSQARGALYSTVDMRDGLALNGLTLVVTGTTVTFASPTPGALLKVNDVVQQINAALVAASKPPIARVGMLDLVLPTTGSKTVLVLDLPGAVTGGGTSAAVLGVPATYTQPTITAAKIAAAYYDSAAKQHCIIVDV
jgi:hypothetical protein